MVTILVILSLISLVFSIFVLSGYAVDQYIIRAKDRQIHDLLMCYTKICSDRSDKYRAIEMRFICYNCVKEKTIFVNNAGYL